MVRSVPFISSFWFLEARNRKSSAEEISVSAAARASLYAVSILVPSTLKSLKVFTICCTLAEFSAPSAAEEFSRISARTRLNSFFALWRLPRSLSSMASVIWRPIFTIGLSEESGSWKIMEIRFPRIVHISSSEIFSRSLPS